MKSFFKAIIQFKLKFFAQRILAKYDPVVIAITGSFGKTSTKEAVFSVLKASVGSVRKSQGNLNTEFGLPLTIFGAENPGMSPFKWCGVFVKAIALLVTHAEYPRYLVVEMGADKPGDIAYLLSIAQPKVSVLTGIGHTHLSQFGSVDAVAKEKLQLISALPDDGVAVFNGDSDLIAQFITTPEVRYLTYGTSSDVEVRANDLSVELFDLEHEKATALRDDHIGGLSFKIVYQNQEFQAYLVNQIGRGHVYAALAGLSVAIGLDLDLHKAVEGLRSYHGEPGRMHMLKGIKHTFLLDDTYNASPEATELALETLSDLSCQGKKWAVLGDMLEMGEQAAALHQRVGKRVAELDIDYLVTKGVMAKHIAAAAQKAGVEAVFSFADNKSAGRFIQAEMKEGDLILIKGSRGMRMEEITKEIMAEPLRAKELLVH